MHDDPVEGNHSNGHRTRGSEIGRTGSYLVTIQWKVTIQMAREKENSNVLGNHRVEGNHPNGHMGPEKGSVMVAQNEEQNF